ncbi:MAG: hypothetical protein RLZZ401_1390 [Pseudomonadota bacterium]
MRNFSLNPIALVQRRFQAWWQARLTPSDSLLLTQRNVYILPTRVGFMLAATLLVLLIASINYQLNLGYLLTFLLAGSAIVGMHLCHSTLRGLTLHLLAPDPQFAGGNVLLALRLSSASSQPRHGIALRVLDDPLLQAHWVWTDVPAAGSAQVQVAWRANRRGRHAPPLLTAETRFPLGTFRVWTVWRAAAPVLVYPAPEPHPPPLPAGEPRASGVSAPSTGSGEFDGVRAYRRGDPLKSVVWKKAAKALATGSGELVSRDTQQNQRFELWLDFAKTGLPGAEARLSRLCAWVLSAERLALDYGLRLPGEQIAPACGEAHKRRCLEALALC